MRSAMSLYGAPANMFFVARTDFVDRTMDGDAFADCVEMLEGWLRAGTDERHAGGRSVKIELRAWGSPRAEVADLARALEASAARRALPPARVSLLDDDTISVLGEPARTGAELFPYRWLELATGPELDRHYVNLRVSVAAANRGNTLVVAGETREGELVVKALWPTGASGAGERHQAIGGWCEETIFLAALRAHRQGVREAPAWSRELFPGPRVARVADFLTWVISPTSDRPGPFFGRLVALGAIPVACAALLLSVDGLGVVGWLAAAAVSLAAVACIGFLVWQKAWMIVSLRAMNRAALARIYSEPLELPPIDLVEEGHLDDPAVRKHSRDVEHLGAVHFVDTAVGKPSANLGFQRIYVLPSDETFLHLSFLTTAGDRTHFPANAAFAMLVTYLADGARVVSLNARAGHRKPLVADEVLRVYPGLDVWGLVAKHRATLERLAARGRRAAAIDPESILARLKREHEVFGSMARERGYYGWEDAVRETFDLVRREYRD
jgi:hypothetical protein